MICRNEIGVVAGLHTCHQEKKILIGRWIR